MRYSTPVLMPNSSYLVMLILGILIPHCRMQLLKDGLLRDIHDDSETSQSNSPQDLRAATQHRNAPSLFGRLRDALSFPHECEYDKIKYNCSLGASCWWRGGISVNLCGGGLIWSCCVPPEDYRKVPPALENIECGMKPMEEGKIVGGAAGRFGQHPWQVALVQPYFSAENVYCGGALISEEFVLTAAHCVIGKKVSRSIVRLGDHNIKAESELYPHVDHAVHKFIVHKNFSSSKDHIINDIALLQLAERVTFRKHIVPVCLPAIGAEFAGKMATVSGWGRIWHNVPMSPLKLQVIEVEIVDNKVCQQWFADGQRSIHIRRSWLCAGFKEGKKDSCTGDSGGPLVVERDGRAELIGIVSFGFSCGLPNAPGIYTNVSNYVTWIEGSMNHAMSTRSKLEPAHGGPKAVTDSNGITPLESRTDSNTESVVRGE